MPALTHSTSSKNSIELQTIPSSTIIPSHTAQFLKTLDTTPEINSPNISIVQLDTGNANSSHDIENITCIIPAEKNFLEYAISLPTAWVIIKAVLDIISQLLPLFYLTQYHPSAEILIAHRLFIILRKLWLESIWNLLQRLFTAISIEFGANGASAKAGALIRITWLFSITLTPALSSACFLASLFLLPFFYSDGETRLVANFFWRYIPAIFLYHLSTSTENILLRLRLEKWLTAIRIATLILMAGLYYPLIVTFGFNGIGYGEALNFFISLVAQCFIFKFHPKLTSLHCFNWKWHDCWGIARAALKNGVLPMLQRLALQLSAAYITTEVRNIGQSALIVMEIARVLANIPATLAWSITQLVQSWIAQNLPLPGGTRRAQRFAFNGLILVSLLFISIAIVLNALVIPISKLLAPTPTFVSENRSLLIFSTSIDNLGRLFKSQGDFMLAMLYTLHAEKASSFTMLMNFVVMSFLVGIMNHLTATGLLGINAVTTACLLITFLVLISLWMRATKRFAHDYPDHYDPEKLNQASLPTSNKQFTLGKYSLTQCLPRTWWCNRCRETAYTSLKDDNFKILTPAETALWTFNQT
ncbi:MAG: hypothetical protein Tsb005_10180 [Gammaproteobacteria bacterium]